MPPNSLNAATVEWYFSNSPYTTSRFPHLPSCRLSSMIAPRRTLQKTAIARLSFCSN